MQQSNQPPAAPSVSQPPAQGRLKAHRGGAVLALGIIGLVLCVICGIIAWVMGKNDLKEMDAGIMDPAGRGMTNAGKICGMIGVILACIGLVFWLLTALVAIISSA